jgi:nicotinamide riboside transporter PnuC
MAATLVLRRIPRKAGIELLLILGSTILTVLLLCSQWFLARRWIAGWWVAIAGNVLDIPYSIVTRQYAFAITAVISIVIAVRGVHHWHDEPAR